jgi:hypothetical protein
MNRHFALSFTLAIMLGVGGAAAQTPAQQKSPAQLAAESNAIAEKHEACRLEAIEKKISVVKRHSYIKTCMKR